MSDQYFIDVQAQLEKLKDRLNRTTDPAVRVELLEDMNRLIHEAEAVEQYLKRVSG